MGKLRLKLKESERKSPFYQHFKEAIVQKKPDFFCTNRRLVNAIILITSAEGLGIPSSVFIFSWDNSPKATMVVETNYYLFWSEHMKLELLGYLPFIQEKQVKITGILLYLILMRQ